MNIEIYRPFLRKKFVCVAVFKATLTVTISSIVSSSTAADNGLSHLVIKANDLTENYVSGLAAGQSSTVLPNGEFLILGGYSAAPDETSNEYIYNAATKKITHLKSNLNHKRLGHSATLLPSGNVFIYGGTDSKGDLVEAAEIYNFQTKTFSVITTPPTIVRTGHTVTVLADGTLLLAGGQDYRGRLIFESEIYDPVKNTVSPYTPLLPTLRKDHSASFLPSSDVLLWGGIDNEMKPNLGADLYSSASQSFTSISAEVIRNISATLATQSTPSLLNSTVSANPNSFPVDETIGLRFSQRMDATSLNEKTVTLIGPQGATPISVIPVEKGVLVFVKSLQDLMPNSQYTLFINGAYSETKRDLEFTTFGFKTSRVDPVNSIVSGGVSVHATPDISSGLKIQADIASSAFVAAQVIEQQVPSQAQEKIDATEAWHPTAKNLKGDWRARRGPSAIQKLPALQASSGVTSLAGQILTLNGNGIPGVELSVGSQTTVSDGTGRFLLSNIVAGNVTLNIGNLVNQKSGKRYGSYQVRVPVKADKTNVLPYTIWDTQLDDTGTVKLSSPIAQDTVITTKDIPGLELRIPAGTVIRDRDGKIVTDINLTAIPTDRPPFPLPRLGVPTYFTIQPGGATLTGVNGQSFKGAQLIYPNYSASTPGTRIDFWNYDARGKGWYIYGKGTTSKDGKQVIPDPGVAIYEFTGAMISAPANAPPDGPPPVPGRNGVPDGNGGPGDGDGGPGDGLPDPGQPPQPPPECGDPVDCATGLFLQSNTDLYLPDIFPIRVARTYRPRDTASRAFGIGSNLSYDMFLVGDTDPWTYQDLILSDGGRVHYVRTSPGVDYDDAVYTHTSTNTKYYGSTIRRGVGTCYWELSFKMGGRTCFPESYLSINARAAAAISMTDKNGNMLTLTRDSDGNLMRALSPSGRYVDFVYDVNNRITQATDNLHRTISYDYDPDGHLIKVTDPLGQSEVYTYDGSHNMLTVQDKRGNLMVSNVYDANNRVIKQTYADGKSMLFSYTTGADGKVIQTDITNQAGLVVRKTFNGDGLMTALILAPGLPEQKVNLFERAAGTNLLMSVTDPMGRKTSYTYNSLGNLLTQTTLAGTSSATTTTRTYQFGSSQLASITDPLGHATTFEYDLNGNVVKITDATGKVSTYEYDSSGKLTRNVDGMGKITSLAYQTHDLSTVTDPLGRSVSKFYDATGRTLSTTDASGNSTTYDPDALGRTKQLTDSLGYKTTMNFDANNNVTLLKDASDNSHQFAFDGLNSIDNSVDPLLKKEFYTYDARHRLSSKTDRKGQVTHFDYDVFDRTTLITYADGSTVNFYYNAADKVTKIIDSTNGTIERSYDSFDRITQESSPTGTVSYTYYPNGLRRTMTILGQPTITYSYDGANRLTQIDQAAGIANGGMAQQLLFVYDSAGRKIFTTYTNGIKRGNTYDDAGHLISIVYTKSDGSVIGDLSYVYDARGQRIKVGGSLARSELPAEVIDVNVDAANRLTKFGAKILAYDLNGNLIDDGTQKFVWDARNQLVQIKSAQGMVLSSYVYDALGRRQSKVVDGVPSAYVYDGINVVQELNSIGLNNSNPSSVKANYLTGDVDETFARWTGEAGNVSLTTYLTDAIGSVIRLTNAAGDKVVDYTYGPFGTTSADAIDNNSFQYTSRENDLNGLYYYRGRYYYPEIARFISLDPIGLQGGSNLYAYANANPLMFTDPYGLYGWADMPSIPQPLLDFTTGIADSMSLGLGPAARQAAGVDGGVNRCSNAYAAGEWASLATGIGRMAYAGIARTGAALAANGRAAVAFRNEIKRTMRGPLYGSNYRIKTYEAMLEKYGTDEAVQSAAGRTNNLANASGVDAWMGGAACGCP